jgi:hypothetical protein
MKKDRLINPDSGNPPLLPSDHMLDDLNYILKGSTRGDPESLLCWTFKSTRKIADELAKKGHKISLYQVKQLLYDKGYSLKSNITVEEWKKNKDCNAQLKFINKLCERALEDGQPVLSIDTKKKNLIGNYNYDGKRARKKAEPYKEASFYFPDPNTLKEATYGIYDLGINTGYVNFQTNQDTSTFAVNSICGWWKYEGSKSYKDLRYLVITADGGCSNGPMNKLWKVNMQGLANFLGAPIHISHFPPSTSKWNNVESRLFSFITSDWEGGPLQDSETIVKLISHTKPDNGLTLKCRLDRSQYKTGRKATPEELASLNLAPKVFHGEWNYIIHNEKI